MKLFNAIALTAFIGGLLGLPQPAKALTTEQAEVGGMLAGVMCLRSKNLIDESTAKTAIRTTIENEGYSFETVGDVEVKEFALKMLRIISKDENCEMD